MAQANDLTAFMNEAWARIAALPAPTMIPVGPVVHRLIRAEWAAIDAAAKFFGRNRRRIKREMNRARREALRG